jgi:hypothetical protein
MALPAGRTAAWCAGGVLLLAALVAGPGCSPGPRSPEDEIRALIAEAERAAESKELAALRSMIAEDYRDAARRDRRELVRRLAGYFLRNDSIHLLVRIREVRAADDGRGEVQLYLAAAGRPISDLQALIPLRADLYRVDLVMVREDGDWRVSSARWERADRQRIIRELLGQAPE